MGLRRIDGLPFIVQRQGKREFTRTPEEVVAIENRAIADGQTVIADCRIEAEAIRQHIESALIAGEPTADLRAELVAVTEQLDGFVDTVAESAENSLEADRRPHRRRASTGARRPIGNVDHPI